MQNISDKIIAFIPKEQIEPEAMQQIENTASLPFIYKHVAVMPDTHFGKGATVGTVLPTQGAIVPAALGVDIACGMISSALRDPAYKIEGKYKDIREGIERRIPMSAGKFNSKITFTASQRIKELEQAAGDDLVRYDKISPNWREQLGTLGGGNHFVELCHDENGVIWATLHSGSRGIGNKLANIHMDIAKKLMAKYYITLPDPDLAYLVEGTPEFDQYMKDVNWSTRFAFLNRDEMMDRVLMEVSHHATGDWANYTYLESDRINCHHNYVSRERHYGKDIWVTRKGAISASEGEWGMIPGSMGAKSYLVVGKGNRESFNSAPHGAGRRMSRMAAKKKYTMSDLQTAMANIEHRDSEALIDEIPDCYKDIDMVMEQASALVEVKHTLSQFINIKGD